jgi:hypothetical protein
VISLPRWQSRFRGVLVFAVLLCACRPAPPSSDATIPDSVAEASESLSVVAQDSAKAVVHRYLSFFPMNDFDSAAAYADLRAWRRTAATWFQGGDTLSLPQFFERACEAGLYKCVLFPRVLKAERGDSGWILVTVEFYDGMGELFIRGPCCGSEGPPDSTFTYLARLGAEGPKVAGAPMYVP